MVLLGSQSAWSPDCAKAGQGDTATAVILSFEQQVGIRGREENAFLWVARVIFPDKLFSDLVYNPHDHGYFIWHM